MRWTPKNGDLVHFKEGPFKGRFGTLTSDVYTHRHMESQDYEMEAHGMGHLAGTYCSAFNIVFTNSGERRRIIFGKHKFDIVESIEEHEAAG